MQHPQTHRIGVAGVSLLVLALHGLAVPQAMGQSLVTLLNDMVLDEDALLMPTGSTYGREINGVSFQDQPLLTYNGYQYTAWYHLGPDDEDVYFGRRDLTGTTWEFFDTGVNFDRGDNSWDAHNIISLGVSGDGRIHFSWDHHGNTLRYMNTDTGVATNPGAITWDQSILNPERNSLNVGGSSIGSLTYPRFITKPDGDVLFSYRDGGSGNGRIYFATYDQTAGLWDAPHQVTSSTGFYSDVVGDSNARNAYLNGVDIEPDGNIHITWTYRESDNGNGNHDIMYAYSEDGGDTWLNNDGAEVGSVGSPIDLDSPGIIIAAMDRHQSLINQQAQAVDLDGGVHALMWHRRFDEPGYEWQSGDPVYYPADSAYYHYYRDPDTGDWQRNQLPVTEAVGGRPKIGYDAEGNVFAVYLSPDSAGGIHAGDNLIIAGATRAANYTDWSILLTDERGFVGEPLIDQDRLLSDDVLSIFIQEDGPASGSPTGTPLHVLEFGITGNLFWAGDVTGAWDTDNGADWDTTGDDLGNAVFSNGDSVTFDDGATTLNVNVANPVSPASTTFNNAANAYTLTGAGIGGGGKLSLNGGGTVTLNNSANTYTGDTHINDGTLALSGNGTIAVSPNIYVNDGATLDVSGLNAPFTLSNGQTLHNNSNDTVVGDVVAGNGSTVTGTGAFANNVTAQSGSVIRVGGAGLPSTPSEGVTVIDDFSGDLSAYTDTRLLDANGGDANTYSWQIDGISGSVEIETTSYDGIEQYALTRTDFPLAVGDEVQVDYAGDNLDAQDIGLWVGSDHPTMDVREDYINIYVRNNGQLLSRGFDGATELGLVSVGSPVIDTLFIAHTAADEYELGWYEGETRNILVTRTGMTGVDGGGIGLYADIRATGTRGNVDNLAIATTNGAPEYTGEMMTVLGNLTMEAGATLELDLYDVDAFDLLSVTGAFTAAGTLDITLEPGASSPQAGDTFDILDFASAGGAFDTLNLPGLDPGLFWKTSNLMTTGVLEVVSTVPGDADGDGDVDLDDYNIMSGNMYTNVAGGASDGDFDEDGDVDFEDFVIQALNFGNWPDAEETLADPVPEPASAALLALMTLTLSGRRNRKRR